MLLHLMIINIMTMMLQHPEREEQRKAASPRTRSPHITGWFITVLIMIGSGLYGHFHSIP